MREVTTTERRTDSPYSVMRRHWLHEYEKYMQKHSEARAQIETDHTVVNDELGLVIKVTIINTEHLYKREALRKVETETWHKMIRAMNTVHDIAVREARRRELSQLRAELLRKNELLMQRQELLQDSSEALTIELHHAHACLRSKTHRRPIATCRAGNAPNILMSYPRKKGTPIKS